MRNLKTDMGYILLGATVLYCIGITIALLYGCTFSEIVKDLILIILTWFLSKSGSVIDYFYGAAQEKTNENPPVPHPVIFISSSSAGGLFLWFV